MSVLGALMSVQGQAQDVGPVVTEGFIGAPIATVWNMWTTNEGLRSWLTPRAEIDLRVGGLIRTNYRENEVLGDPGTIIYTIRELVPFRLLSYQITGPPRNWQFPNAVRDLTVTIYFAAADDRSTAMRMVASGFTADDESQRMRAFFQSGDALTLERLQLHVRALR